MQRRHPYRIQIYISLELEELAREKAYNAGLIKGGQGMVGNYIAMLIMEDLKDRPVFAYEELDHKRTKRINITFPEELISDVKNRAAELGFSRNDEGNVSEYINFLLSKKLKYNL